MCDNFDGCNVNSYIVYAILVYLIIINICLARANMYLILVQRHIKLGISCKFFANIFVFCLICRIFAVILKKTYD